MAVVIVGSGLAGYLLVKGLRDQGYQDKIIVVTKDSGDFYSKPLLSAALAQKKLPDQLLTLTADQMIERYNLELYAQQQVVALHPEQQCVVLDNQQVLPYQYCILATGARPRQLEIPGMPEVLQINHLDDYRLFREQLEAAKNIAVLGGGLVGTEFVADLTHQQSRQLSWYHRGDYPLDGLVPEFIGQALLKSLTNKGIFWHGSAEPLTTEQLHEITQSDLVLAAIGLESCSELAREAGLEVQDGIVVDRYCQTSAANIFALGDCAQVAGHMLRYVAPIRHCVASLVQKIVYQKSQAVVYPAMPIMVKNPMFPMIACIPPIATQGRWQLNGEPENAEAVFYDQHQEPVGLVLTGSKIKLRGEWLKRLPKIFPEPL